MSGHFFPLYSFSRPLLVRPLTPYLYNPMKKCSQRNSNDNLGPVIDQERAPSLADEFKRVAEEKAKADDVSRPAEEQGVASQTTDKSCDGNQEAVVSNGNIKRVKKTYEEHELGADHCGKGD